MPKLWDRSIEAHRKEVTDAIMSTTAELVAERGVLSVTMSQIAERAGIGRATLYKYFPDVETILIAWHDHQVRGHLDDLAEIRDRAGTPAETLQQVLHAYAFIQHDLRSAHGTELEAFLHRREHVAKAQHELHEFLVGVLVAGAEAGAVRDDTDAHELASYCLHSLSAAAGARSKAAVRRLIDLTLSGLRPPN